jgi:hypothetical protein
MGETSSSCKDNIKMQLHTPRRDTHEKPRVSETRWEIIRSGLGRYPVGISARLLAIPNGFVRFSSVSSQVWWDNTFKDRPTPTPPNPYLFTIKTTGYYILTAIRQRTSIDRYTLKELRKNHGISWVRNAEFSICDWKKFRALKEKLNGKSVSLRER